MRFRRDPRAMPDGASVGTATTPTSVTPDARGPHNPFLGGRKQSLLPSPSTRPCRQRFTGAQSQVRDATDAPFGTGLFEVVLENADGLRSHQPNTASSTSQRSPAPSQTPCANTMPPSREGLRHPPRVGPRINGATAPRFCLPSMKQHGNCSAKPDIPTPCRMNNLSRLSPSELPFAYICAARATGTSSTANERVHFAAPMLRPATSSPKSAITGVTP